jgi:Peptidase A4 family
VKGMVWRGAGGLLVALLSASLSAALAQSPAAPPVAGALGATAHAAPGKVVPTNLPGVYAYTQPPAGFDPGAATPEALARYGYPPRPEAAAGAEALAEWQRVTDPALRRIVPALVRTNRYHRPVAGLRVDERNAAATSSNWSGFALVGGASTNFFSVVGHWTVPTAQQAFGVCSGGWDYSSQWAGIDGYTNADVLQSGSEADAYCDVGQQVSEYYPWLEWFPGPEYVIYQSTSPLKLPPFDPGDYLTVHVWATDWKNGVSKTGNLLFTDLTQNWQASFTFTAASVGGTTVAGRSAEWIVERPALVTGNSFTLLTLANYIANPWNTASATDLNQFAHSPAAPGSAVNYNITMLDNDNAPISRVTLYGNTALWFYNEGSSR